jgi:hypothetical protein
MNEQLGYPVDEQNRRAYAAHDEVRQAMGDPMVLGGRLVAMRERAEKAERELQTVLDREAASIARWDAKTEKLESERDEASRYIEGLLTSLAAKHWPAVGFQPLSGDLWGMISQIDNMTSGMTRAEKAEAQNDKLKEALHWFLNGAIPLGLITRDEYELVKKARARLAETERNGQ